MKKEYVSEGQMGPYSKLIIYAILSFFPLLGIILSVVAIFVSYNSYVHDGYPFLYVLVLFLLIIFCACLCYALGWVLISNGLAQYRFGRQGLYVKYPLKKEIILPWDHFQQVCVCYAAYTTRGERRANTVICCVRKGEKKNIYGRWKTDNPFHYRSVICIDYKTPLLEGLKDVYPGTVVDLRNSAEYKLQ